MKHRGTKAWWLAAVVAAAGVMSFAGCGGKSEKERQAAFERAESRKVPQITWEDVAIIDTIEQGDTVIRDFVYYNTGWRPVKIKHALPNRPECSCRIPTKDTDVGARDTVQLRCVFSDFEPRAAVEILVEHNTPQPVPTLVYMGTMLRK